MKNWKIGTRIIAGFGMMILITMALGLFAYNRATATEKVEGLLADNALPSVGSLNNIVPRLEVSADLMYKSVANTDAQTERALETQMLALQEANATDFKKYEATPMDDKEKELYEHAKVARAIYLQEYEEVRKISALNTADGNARAAKLMDTDLRVATNSYDKALEEVIDYDIKNCFNGLRDIQNAVKSSQSGVLIGIAIAILVAVPIAMFIVRSITQPLALIVGVLERVAQCDMTATLDIHSKDEIGQMATALNTATTRLRTTLQEVTGSARGASSSSQELSAAAESIASGAQEQAASLEETSASLEEITATVRQSADNARQANQLANSSKESAERGQEVVSNAVSAMGEINVASAKISDIISTIDEIAFQTNLLAVNAAVEAARAGEEGRGFAVVASEVRSLAQRSAGAAKEIKGLIQDTLKKVERGSELVNRSGETLQDIIGSVKRVTDIVGEISAAADEQSTGVDQVNTAITQIDQVTQSNSSQTEELAATANSLSDQARRLTKLVSVFKLSEGAVDAPEPVSERGTEPVRPKRTTVRVVAGKIKAKAALSGALIAPAMPMLATAAAGAGSDSSFEEF